MRKIFNAIGQGTLVFFGIKILARVFKDYTCRTKVTVDWSNAKYIETQLIIWKKPGVSEKAFKEWKRSRIPVTGIRRTKICGDCDNTLELWEGKNVSVIISGGTPGTATVGNPAGGSSGPTGGGDDIACYSYNIIIDFPEPNICSPGYDSKCIQVPSQPELEDPAVIVAVFDTGLEPSIKEVYTSKVPTCMPGGNMGWNFAGKNNNTDDDHPSGHGSVVSKFIIDQATNYRKQKINILPVKIHNKSGKADLFSVLCGFAYAANCGAKIINASFGFYGAKNSEPPTILAEFVKKHLTDKNILLVAAAGNVNADKSLIPSEMNTIRNLDINPFFPAALARDFDNVLAVTTVSTEKNAVSPSQNFSNTIVDIGVQCDQEVDGDYRFEDPLESPDASGKTVFILGSSYATPVVTGIIAQHYKELISSMSGGTIDKKMLIKKLQEHAANVMTTEGNLLNLIVDGNCCLKQR